MATRQAGVQASDNDGDAEPDEGLQPSGEVGGAGADPSLRGRLHGVPGAAQRRGVGQVEVSEGVDSHAVVQGAGVDVHAGGDCGVAVADELGAEQLSAALVAGDRDRDRFGARVVGLVIVDAGHVRGGIESVLSGIGVAQTGPGGYEVEDFDRLGAQRAGELPVAAVAFSPATRPCLCEVLPSGRYVFVSRSRW